MSLWKEDQDPLAEDFPGITGQQGELMWHTGTTNMVCMKEMPKGYGRDEIPVHKGNASKNAHRELKSKLCCELLGSHFLLHETDGIPAASLCAVQCGPC